jgi:heme/copper-type cytochrome/quinol oxidase subunit 4
MIDPLRPYWPTNRSIAGLLVRSVCLLAAAFAVAFGASRPFTLIVVLAAALAQASLLVFEWMEFKRSQRAGLIAGGVIVVLFVSLVLALVIESRSFLVLSVR